MPEHSNSSFVPRPDFVLLERLATALGLLGLEGGSPTNRCILAVSGGADSMALLALMAQLRQTNHGYSELGLIGVGIDHGTRRGAARELGWAQGLSGALGIPFEIAQVQASAADEQTLRTLRYQELFDAADRHHGAWILTAHTADDQIETVLMRLLRGAGRHGLSGIPARNDRILRPLLDFRTQELREYLTRHGYSWVEDPSNRSMSYTRNRLRHQVLPKIHEAFGETSLDHLPDMAKRWAAEDRYLHDQAMAFLAECAPSDPHVIDLNTWSAAAPALQANVLRVWYRRVGAMPQLGLRALGDLEALARNPRGGARITLGSHCFEQRGGKLRCWAAVSPKKTEDAASE